MKNSKPQNNLILFLLSVGGIALLLTLLVPSDKVGNLLSVLLPVAGAIYKTFDEKMNEWSKSRQEQIDAAVKGKFDHHPLFVLFTVVIYLQLIERTIGALIGGAIGFALALLGQSALIVPVVLIVSPLFVLFLSAFLIILIVKDATHQIEKYPLLWIIGALVIDQIIDIASARLILGIAFGAALGSQIAVLILLLPGTIIGWNWGKRTQRVFVLQRLFKHLTPSEQKDLIDLVQTLPSLAS